ERLAGRDLLDHVHVPQQRVRRALQGDVVGGVGTAVAPADDQAVLPGDLFEVHGVAGREGQLRQAVGLPAREVLGRYLVARHVYTSTDLTLSLVTDPVWSVSAASMSKVSPSITARWRVVIDG